MTGPLPSQPPRTGGPDDPPRPAPPVPPPPAPRSERRPLRRGRGVLAGICAGAGVRLGVDPLVLRVLFLVASAAGGIGVAVYLLLWVSIPRDPHAAVVDPAPVRTGSGRSARGSAEVAAGTGLLVISVLLLFRAWGLWVGDAVAWPLVLVSVGAAVLWRQLSAPSAAQDGPRTDAGAGERRPVAATSPLSGTAQGRVLLGAGLIIGGALVFLALTGTFSALRDVLVTVVVVLVAVLLILAPLWVRLWRGVEAERSERIRSQERAEVAAHLHDSVLQTLALMQTQADDPQRVAQLARRQERELRQWLNGGRPGDAPATLAAALKAAAAEVEDANGVVVEVVTVGDRALDPDAEALVAATREALVNAARHGSRSESSRHHRKDPDLVPPGGRGAAPIALFMEAGRDRVEVFVRDRGAGFDPDAIPADRRGVRESIVGRMARHNGSATIHSAPGAGTEVELVLESRS